MIIGLGMAVLTEDAVNFGELERPLRARDQWSYHSRLYEAAATVGDRPICNSSSSPRSGAGSMP